MWATHSRQFERLPPGLTSIRTQGFLALWQGPTLPQTQALKAMPNDCLKLGTFVLLGSILCASTEAQYEWNAYSQPHSFGYDVAPLGDRDLDGVPDFAVLHGFYGSNSWSGWQIDFVSGASGNLLGVIPTPGASNNTGGSFGTIGDVDGDGIREVIIGNHQPPKTPRKWLSIRGQPRRCCTTW